jgi:hypothetical protein
LEGTKPLAQVLEFQAIKSAAPRIVEDWVAEPRPVELAPTPEILTFEPVKPSFPATPSVLVFEAVRQPCALLLDPVPNPPAEAPKPVIVLPFGPRKALLRPSGSNAVGMPTDPSAPLPSTMVFVPGKSFAPPIMIFETKTPPLPPIPGMVVFESNIAQAPISGILDFAPSEPVYSPIPSVLVFKSNKRLFSPIPSILDFGAAVHRPPGVARVPGLVFRQAPTAAVSAMPLFVASARTMREDQWSQSPIERPAFGNAIALSESADTSGRLTGAPVTFLQPAKGEPASEVLAHFETPVQAPYLQTRELESVPTTPPLPFLRRP